MIKGLMGPKRQGSLMAIAQQSSVIQTEAVTEEQLSVIQIEAVTAVIHCCCRWCTMNDCGML